MQQHKRYAKRMHIQLDKIAPAKFNPPTRVKESALAGLREDIRKRGLLSPVHVINGGEDYILVDGHRRFKIMQELGEKRIAAVVHDTPREKAAELWAALNRNTRSVSGFEWLVMWWLAGPACAKSLPPNVRTDIKQAEEIFGGKEGMRPLYDGEVGPSIVRDIVKTFLMLTNWPSLAPLPSRGDFGLWMIRHHTISMVHTVFCANRGANASLAAARRILAAVKADKPLTTHAAFNGRSRTVPTVA